MLLLLRSFVSTILVSMRCKCLAATEDSNIQNWALISVRNAGVFIWIDLRRFLFPKSTCCEVDFSVLKSTSPDVSLYKEREAYIINRCIDNGVMIAPGTIYATPELGWFRITFTVGRYALEEGLHRIWKSLEQIK